MSHRIRFRGPPLGAGRVGVEQEQPTGLDHDRGMRNRPAFVQPLRPAGFHVQAEHGLAGVPADLRPVPERPLRFGPRTEQLPAGHGQPAPAPRRFVRACRQRVRLPRGAGRGVQSQAVVRDHDEQAVGGGGQIRAFVGHRDPAGTLDLPLPQLPAIVGIVGLQPVVPLHEQPSRDAQRRRACRVPVEHPAGPRIAEPQRPQRAADPLVQAAAGVRRVGVLVAPPAGARQRTARELRPRPVRLDANVRCVQAPQPILLELR